MNKSRFNFRVGALMATYQRLDRTISGVDVVTHYEPNQSSITAYTDGINIHFGNRAIAPDVVNDAQALLALDGLNYHELCHVMYTPRTNDIPSWIRTNSARKSAWGILEDQRIETIFTTLYPDNKPYLRMAVIRHILQVKEQNHTNVFLLLYGRKYLYRSMIKTAENSYFDPARIDEAKDIIDSYIALDGNINAQPDVYRDLIDRFINLLPKDDDGEPSELANMFGHGEGGEEHGTGLNQGKQIVINLKDIKKSTGDAPSDEGDPIDTNAVDGDSEDDNDANGVSQPGKGHGSLDDDSEDLIDVANKAKEAVMDSIEVINHVRATQRVFRNDEGKMYSLGVKPAGYNHGEPDARLNNIVTKVSEKYRALLEDADPGYISSQAYGRISIDRVMRDSPIDSVFDRWEDNQTDATDIEVVIGLDVSYSMGSAGNELGQVGWCLKRAIGSLGERCKVSVFTYSSGFNELYSRDSEAGQKVRIPIINGGTQPIHFLDHAEHIFTNTNRKNKVMIMMTDGEWEQASVCDAKIDELNKSGVVTGLYHYGRGKNTHRVQVFNSSSDLSGLIRFSDNLVKLSMKNNL